MRHMFWPKLSLLSACVALTISLALAVDWLAAEWFNVGSPTTRAALLAVSLGLVAVWMSNFVSRQWALGNEALSQLDRLCRMDWRRLALAGGEQSFATLRPGNAWVKMSRRLRERMAGLARRVDELERERSVFETRARRYEAQTQHIQSVLSALGEPVLVIDKRDELVLANSSANALFAIDPSNVERRAISTLVECERLVELLTDTRKCKVSTQRSCEIEIPDPVGASMWYRVTARNIPTQPGQSDPDGTSQGVVAVLHDISLQKTIQKRNAELVSAVSHEMRTPLAGIKAYLELLADGDADDEKTEKQFLQVIGAETNRLQSLVDELVELARIEADLAGATKQVQPLRDALADAWQAIKPQAEAKSLSLLAELGDAQLRVLLDRHMITQAALHLLSNAVKYTPDGGRVTLRSRDAGHEACFEVEDTGVGLSSEDCEKVFEKFYRVPRLKDMAVGTGLGLPLVKHIVEDVHGGRIEVQSRLQRGTVFRVFLPAAEADQNATPSPSPAARAIEESIP
jgi:two-component system phosphate regulon sensor histidine kinase PhoR